MKFLIPSYRRSDSISAVSMLRKYGISKDDIFVGVQDKQDYDLYRNKVKEANVVYKHATSASGNRNNLLCVLRDNEQAVFIDDDVQDILSVHFVDKKRVNLRTIDEQQFNDLVLEGFVTAGDGVWGIQHNPNPIRIAPSAKKKYLRNVLIEGSFIGFTNGNIAFDEDIKIGEDYDACARAIVSGIDTFRFTRFVVCKPQNGKQSGGCHSLYEKGDIYRHKELLKIVKRYPGLLRFVNKKPDCASIMVKERI